MQTPEINYFTDDLINTWTVSRGGIDYIRFLTQSHRGRSRKKKLFF